MFKNKPLFSFILFVMISITVGEFFKNRSKKLLSTNTNTSIAKFQNVVKMVNRGSVSYFEFEHSNEKIIVDVNGLYPFLNKGDTVLIKYSLEDPSIAEIIDFCYMQKHKGKCK
jgi:hypothetical protein